MIADTIKSLRENAGYTQAELAKKLCITRSSVNAWEMGISVPTTQFVIELANIFGVSTDYILEVSKNYSVSLDKLNETQKSIVLSLVAYFDSLNSADNRETGR